MSLPDLPWYTANILLREGVKCKNRERVSFVWAWPDERNSPILSNCGCSNLPSVTTQLFVVNANRTKNAPNTDRPTAVRPFLDLAIEIAHWYSIKTRTDVLNAHGKRKQKTNENWEWLNTGGGDGLRAWAEAARGRTTRKQQQARRRYYHAE